MLEARRSGAGVLLISDDLYELLTLSDSMYVIFGGVIKKVPAGDRLDMTAIGLMMSGEGMAR